MQKSTGGTRRVFAGEQPSADEPSAPAQKRVELRLRVAKPRGPKRTSWSRLHPRVCTRQRGPCRWKASRALGSLDLGGSEVEEALAAVKTCRFAGTGETSRQGCLRSRRFGSPGPNTSERDSTLISGRPLCSRGKRRRPKLACAAPNRLAIRGWRCRKAIWRRRGRFVVKGHASRGSKRRRRSRRSKGESLGPRNQNAPPNARDNKLVAETGEKSPSPAAEGALRSVVGVRREITRPRAATHAPDRAGRSSLVNQGLRQQGGKRNSSSSLSRPSHIERCVHRVGRRCSGPGTSPALTGR